MKHSLLMVAALALGSAALAQGEYPRCSRDVKDHCMQDQGRAADEHGGRGMGMHHGHWGHGHGHGHWGHGHHHHHHH